MGCWNATCSVSNLPIFAGEKVVLIPLVKTLPKPVYNCCYPIDNFSPFSFPIIGEYNDYGGIENVNTTYQNAQYLKSFEYYYKDHEGNFKKHNKYERFEDFVCQVLCCHEDNYVKLENNILFPEGMAEINFMMVHYDLYMLLVKEIGNRRPYGRKENYKTAIRNKFCEILEKQKEQLSLYKKVRRDNNVDKEKRELLYTLGKDTIVNDISHQIFCYGQTLGNHYWNYFSELILSDEKDTERYISLAVEKALFTTALSCGRKGYLCTSGCGSQSEETKIQYLIAKYTINHIRDIAKAQKEYNEDDTTSPNGTAEQIFF